MKDEIIKDISAEFEAGHLSKAEFKDFCAQIENKDNQRAKLVEDYKAGKIEEKDYDMWITAITDDIHRIKVEVMATADRNINHKKRMTDFKNVAPFMIGLAVIALVVAGVSLSNFLYSKRNVADIGEPIQTDMTEILASAQRPDEVVTKKYFERNYDTFRGYTYYANLEYLAKYEIEGLIISIKEYDDSTLYNRAFPIDIGLAWGELATLNSKIDVKHGNRKLSVTLPQDVLNNAQSGRAILHQFSNNHIITETSEVYNKLRKFRVGDVIVMHGYLVRANITEGNEKLALESSLSRMDSMDGAFDTTNTGCEVFFVESVDEVKK